MGVWQENLRLEFLGNSSRCNESLFINPVDVVKHEIIADICGGNKTGFNVNGKDLYLI